MAGIVKSKKSLLIPKGGNSMKKKIFDLLVYSYAISTIITAIAFAIFCVQEGLIEGFVVLVAAAVWTLLMAGPIALVLHTTGDLIDVLRNPRRRIAGIAIIETNAEEGTLTIEERSE